MNADSSCLSIDSVVSSTTSSPQKPSAAVSLAKPLPPGFDSASMDSVIEFDISNRCHPSNMSLVFQAQEDFAARDPEYRLKVFLRGFSIDEDRYGYFMIWCFLCSGWDTGNGDGEHPGAKLPREGNGCNPCDEGMKLNGRNHEVKPIDHRLQKGIPAFGELKISKESMICPISAVVNSYPFCRIWSVISYGATVEMLVCLQAVVYYVRMFYTQEIPTGEAELGLWLDRINQVERCVDIALAELERKGNCMDSFRENICKEPRRALRLEFESSNMNGITRRIWADQEWKQAHEWMLAAKFLVKNMREAAGNKLS